MRAPRRRMAVVAGLLLSVGALVSCSGDDEGGESDDRPAEVTVAPTLPPTTAATESVALGPHPLGVKYALVAVDTYAPYLERLRGTPTFHEAVWCDAEPEQGVFDWSELDRVATVAETYDIELYLKIRVGSCWATGGQIGESRGAREKTASTTPEELSEYDRFVTQLVERYGPRGVRGWAIENEVNTESFWVGGAEAYGALAERGAAVIRAAQPDAVIYDSGLSSLTFGVAVVRDLMAQGREDDALAAYQRYFERRHSTRRRDYPEVRSVDELRSVVESDRWVTSGEYIDETFRLLDEGVVDRLQVHFYETWWSVPDLMSFLRSQLPPGAEAEVWEAGLFWPDAPDDLGLVAGETIKIVTLLFAGGAVSVQWLPLGADPNQQGNEENRFGLIEPDGTTRPVTEPFLSLAEGLDEAEVTPISAGGMAGLVAENGDGTTVVVWSETGGPVELPSELPAGATVVRTDGTTSDGAATATFTVGSDPLVIRLPGASAADLSELTS